MSDKGPLSRDEEAKIRAQFAAWPRDTESRMLATLDAERAFSARVREENVVLLDVLESAGTKLMRLREALQSYLDFESSYPFDQCQSPECRSCTEHRGVMALAQRVMAETGGES